MLEKYVASQRWGGYEPPPQSPLLTNVEDYPKKIEVAVSDLVDST